MKNGIHGLILLLVVNGGMLSNTAVGEGERYHFPTAQKWMAPDGDNAYSFGYSVAVHGDHAIIGAWVDDAEGTKSGSAYVFDVDSGTQLYKLTAFDGRAFDRFGVSVAINDNYAVVGAQTSANGDDSGSVYVYDVDTGDFAHKFSGGAQDDHFGYGVAVNETHVLIGAPHYANASGDYNRGSAYLFDLDTGGLVRTWLDPTQFHAEDRFGGSVAISEDYAVVGSSDTLAGNTGHVYIFDLETGVQPRRIDGIGESSFGGSVAVDGDYLVIGAHNEGSPGTYRGKAYVYNARTGEQLHELQGEGLSNNSRLGYGVAAGGGYAVVGALQSDSAYVFDLATGEEILHLIEEDSTDESWFGRSVAADANGILVGADRARSAYHIGNPKLSFVIATGQSERKIASNDAGTRRFGCAVAVGENRAVVGAAHDDVNGAWSGSAYIIDVETGSQLAKLVPSDGASEAYFGDSVAMDGNTVLIGARHGDGQVTGSGCAYVYDLSTGNPLRKLAADDGAIDDEFGRSLAINGDYAIVGSPSDNRNATGNGSAYVFHVSTGVQLRKLFPADGGSYDHDGNFGNSVAIGEGYAVVGAYHDDETFSDDGSAYVFDVETGDQLYRLTGDSPEENGLFGNSVAVNGNYALIGASGENGGHGNAYLFDLTTGNQLQKLAVRGSYEFGLSVALSEDYAIIGARKRDEYDHWTAGGAYIFDITTGQQLLELMADDTGGLHAFGTSVAIDGQNILIGAPGNEAAYLYNVPEPATIGILAFSGLLMVRRRLPRTKSKPQ